LDEPFSQPKVFLGATVFHSSATLYFGTRLRWFRRGLDANWKRKNLIRWKFLKTGSRGSL
jgi:hypothetical protein